MKKKILLILLILVSGGTNLFAAYHYRMEREPCNSGRGSFYVCRPFPNIGCSVEAQTVCDGYGGGIE
ncbi:hypothetical protein DFQ04_2850 [Algoriphagus boseongensis]|uniref:Uncharacterized protein n=1 Tax=Algoriphagus boseongensis TaxID=1442587 RepID=A0A4R6T5M3_9BACT|nr:hypothetical protein DFQ04_2850 [Algoriphagus boseongensis]